MWIVAKIKNNNFKIFEREFSKKFINEKIVFYYPKIKSNSYFNGKKIEKHISLLENYVFCKCEKFQSINLKSYQFIKGLNFFLEGHSFSQNNIDHFIKFCKLHEDRNGFIDNSFFKNCLSEKGKFISGPFKDLIFETIKKNKKNLKISIGSFLFTVSDKNNCIYRPV